MATSTQHEITPALPQVLEAPDASTGPANGDSASETLYVEYPARPLDDETRDAFLELLDADDEPNEALCKAVEKFKQNWL